MNAKRSISDMNFRKWNTWKHEILQRNRIHGQFKGWWALWGLMRRDILLNKAPKHLTFVEIHLPWNLQAYSVVSSAKPLSVSHDRPLSTDFAEIAITACCWKVGSQDRMESAPQSRTMSAKETELCSSNDINGALFLVNHWSRNPHDLCLFLCCVTSLSLHFFYTLCFLQYS